MSASPARIFAADVVPGPVSLRDGKNGQYLVAPNSTVTMPGGEKVRRTIMSFGSPSRPALPDLRDGVPVKLQVCRSGGAIVALGVVGDAVPDAPAPKPAASRRRRMPAALLADCLASAGFDDHAAY